MPKLTGQPREGLRFEAQEDRRLLRLRESRTAWSVIAGRMRRSRESVMARHAELQAPPATGKTRDCLRCRVPFPSANAGNRMCDDCRTYTAQASPFEPNPIAGHECGRQVPRR